MCVEMLDYFTVESYLKLKQQRVCAEMQAGCILLIPADLKNVRKFSLSVFVSYIFIMTTLLCTNSMHFRIANFFLISKNLEMVGNFEYSILSRTFQYESQMTSNKLRQCHKNKVKIYFQAYEQSVPCRKPQEIFGKTFEKKNA